MIDTNGHPTFSQQNQRIAELLEGILEELRTLRAAVEAGGAPRHAGPGAAAWELRERLGDDGLRPLLLRLLCRACGRERMHRLADWSAQQGTATYRCALCGRRTIMERERVVVLPAGRS